MVERGDHRFARGGGGGQSGDDCAAGRGAANGRLRLRRSPRRSKRGRPIATIDAGDRRGRGRFSSWPRACSAATAGVRGCRGLTIGASAAFAAERAAVPRAWIATRHFRAHEPRTALAELRCPRFYELLALGAAAAEGARMRRNGGGKSRCSRAAWFGFPKNLAGLFRRGRRPPPIQRSRSASARSLSALLRARFLAEPRPNLRPSRAAAFGDRREQPEIHVHRLERGGPGVDGLDMAAGDVREQRAMRRGRRRRRSSASPRRSAAAKRAAIRPMAADST